MQVPAKGVVINSKHQLVLNQFEKGKRICASRVSPVTRLKHKILDSGDQGEPNQKQMYQVLEDKKNRSNLVEIRRCQISLLQQVPMESKQKLAITRQKMREGELIKIIEST